MNDRLFFDTNVLIYAASNDVERSSVARAWLSRGGSFSVKVLNEFTNTARRKLNRSWEEVTSALNSLRDLCAHCVPINESTYRTAVELAQRLGYQFYDALIASAFEANCTMLVSEDMQHAERIDDRLTIHNPFRR